MIDEPELMTVAAVGLFALAGVIFGIAYLRAGIDDLRTEVEILKQLHEEHERDLEQHGSIESRVESLERELFGGDDDYDLYDDWEDDDWEGDGEYY